MLLLLAVAIRCAWGIRLVMTGGTLRHGLICGNIFGEARQALKGTDCRVMNSEIKLYIDFVK